MNDKFMSFIYSQSISFFIIGVNYFLKVVIISLVEWIGQPTVASQMYLITVGIFAAQFFNTGIIILLINANLSEHSDGFDLIFQGRFSDYSPLWYQDVGSKIVSTMIINSILPISSMCSTFATPFAKQFLDSGFTLNPYVSKQRTMVSYKELYSGAPYVIHFRYSELLNCVYITMMYGIGMPILFPIAAFTMLNCWLAERITLAYLVRQPPAMGAVLSRSVMKLLYLAPLLLIFNGFWMVGNR